MKCSPILQLLIIICLSFSSTAQDSTQIDSVQFKKDLETLSQIETTIDSMSITELVSSQGNKILFEALKYNKKVGNKKRVAQYYYKIAAIQFNNKYLDQALSNYSNSMKWAEQANDSVSISYALRGIGLVYARKKIPDSAFYYLDSSVVYVKDEIPSLTMAKYYERKGNIYESINAHDSSLYCYHKGLEYIPNEGSTTSDFASLYESIGVTYNTLGKHELAIKNSEIALKMARESKVGYVESSALNTLAMAHKALKHYKTAYHYLDLFMVARDSIYNVRTSKSILQNQLDFKAEQKAFADSLTMAEHAKVIDAQLIAEKEKSKTQRLVLWFIAIIIVFFIFISILLYKRFKASQQQQLIIEQERAKLASVNTQLKDLHESRSRFFSNIAHEFRTPLSVISGAASELEKTYGADDSIHLITSNNDALLNLVNQILELRKLESGELKLHYRLMDINLLVTQLVNRLQPLAKRKNITIKVEVSLENSQLDVDKHVFERIFTNLLSNAVKFTPANGNISVCIFQENSYYVLSVKDNGKGLTKEQASKVFNRFYQVNQQNEVGVEGTGIGLSLVKDLVTLCSGKIEVESTLGKGATFKVSFPLTRKASPENSLLVDYQSAVLKPSKSTPTKNSKLPVLLLVEDNSDLRLLLTNKLKGNYQIITAENGKIGMQKALEIVPDLILSDVMMPEMNGFELCNHLRENEITSHIPFILLTALTDETHKTTGLKYGADAYLEKPINNEALHAQLDNVWQLKQKIIARYQQENWQLNTTYERVELEDDFIKKVHQIVLSHLDDTDFGPDNLAKELLMSRTQLFKKIKSTTGETVANYTRKLRLIEAQKMLRSQTGLSVKEIAFNTGFSSVQYFSKQYKIQFGTSPSKDSN